MSTAPVTTSTSEFAMSDDTIKTNRAGLRAAAERDGRLGKATAPTEPIKLPTPAAPRDLPPDQLVVEEVSGGYSLHSDRVGKGYYGTVGIAYQRDAHPMHGGGINAATARRRATLFAASEELLAAAQACESVLMLASGTSKAARESREQCLERLRAAIALARGG